MVEDEGAADNDDNDAAMDGATANEGGEEEAPIVMSGCLGDLGIRGRMRLCTVTLVSSLF